MKNNTYDQSLMTKAIVFAAQKHDGEIRKGSEEYPIAYIIHPMEAATIAATMTSDENVIIAALLHDVVEDTDTSLKTIETEFNEIVAMLVADQSENKREDKPAAKTWKIRKQETLDNLKDTSRASKIVTLSDKLSNMRSLNRDYLKIGDKLWDRFNQTDPIEQGWYYTSLKDGLAELKDFEAWQEYERLVLNLFKEYKL
ncbi:MAG: HD domain-containing protein [Erysipelothrix sp.]|nr:HD domain-containing protein [Erysipelothrix sp.]